MCALQITKRCNNNDNIKLYDFFSIFLKRNLITVNVQYINLKNTYKYSEVQTHLIFSRIRQYNCCWTTHDKHNPFYPRGNKKRFSYRKTHFLSSKTFFNCRISNMNWYENWHRIFERGKVRRILKVFHCISYKLLLYFSQSRRNFKRYITR